MDRSDGPEYSRDALKEMNNWVEQVHSELRSSGPLDYGATEVKPLDKQYRREIGEYLSEQFSLDYTSVLFFLDGMEAVYHSDEDIFLVSYESLQEVPQNFELGVLAHEQGHRTGRKLIEDILEPLNESGEVSNDALSTLQAYLLSENFAERTKMAVGNTLGRDFTYWEELADESPLIYRMRDRIGPEQLVDTEREETVPEMMASINDLVTQASTENPEWIN